MNIEYLPIGTVVNLKERNHVLFMIVGMLVENESGERRDYIAVRYPTGVMNKDNYFFFNHEQIGDIFHMGFVNEDHNAYVSLIYAALKKDIK